MADIQAVILAESYPQRFNPISSEIPRVILFYYFKILFPFTHEPLIEKTLNWLINNNVHEIYILYQSLQTEIESYFQNRKAKGKMNISLKLIHTPDSKNNGDQLRELYSHKVIRSDFILIYGDVITNINLQEPIKKYLENQEKEKLNIMQMIVHKGNHSYDEDRYLYTVDHDNLLYYLDNQSKIKFNKDKIKLEKGLPSKVKILSNLRESGVYICSRDVLKSFQENFVFTDIREDFIHEMLTSEIQAENVHIFITPQEQTSIRISHPNAYYLAFQQYLGRFFQPYHAENKMVFYEDFFKYTANESRVDNNANLSELCYVGQNTQIQGNCRITRSIIGKNCKIASGAIIINSILWDNVSIEENVTIKDSLIAHNCEIGANTSIMSGTLISQNTKIKNDLKIVENSRIKTNEQSAMFQYVNENKQGENMGDKQQQETIQNEQIILNSDDDENESAPKKKTKEIGIDEDISILIQNCQDSDYYVQQAIINIETLKVNYNKTFEEIVGVFLPQFLSSLKPDLDSLKFKFELWKDFINRFVSESECQCYFQQLELFCRANPTFYLHQLLQLSYKNQTLNESQLIEFGNKLKSQVDDEFSQEFTKLNANFQTYIESILVENQQEEEYEYYYEDEEQQEEQEQEQEQE